MSKISIGADIDESYLTCRLHDLDRNQSYNAKNRKNKKAARVLVSELQEDDALMVVPTCAATGLIKTEFTDTVITQFFNHIKKQDLQ